MGKNSDRMMWQWRITWQLTWQDMLMRKLMWRGADMAELMTWKELMMWQLPRML
jgi:hypothetical protein